MSTPASTPTAPGTIVRDIDGLLFALSPSGLCIEGASLEPFNLDVGATLALRDFLRTPGVSSLINRAWLAEEHEAAIARMENGKN